MTREEYEADLARDPEFRKGIKTVNNYCNPPKRNWRRVVAVMVALVLLAIVGAVLASL